MPQARTIPATLSLHSDTCHTRYGIRQGNEHIKESRYEDMTSKAGNASTDHDMTICHVSSIYRYTAILPGSESRNQKPIFAAINQNTIATFQRHYQIAIHPKNPPCHHTARLKQTRYRPTSRNSYCKSLAIPHLLIANDNFT